MAQLSSDDPRLGWLGERVCLALGAEPDAYQYLLNEKNADGVAKERYLGCDLDGARYTLQKFFSEETKSGSAIFFFPCLEDVEEEIEVQEAVVVNNLIPAAEVPTAAGDGSTTPAASIDNNSNESVSMDDNVSGIDHQGDADSNGSPSIVLDVPGAAVPAQEDGAVPAASADGEQPAPNIDGEDNFSTASGNKEPLKPVMEMRTVIKKVTVTKRRVKVTMDQVPPYAHDNQQIYFLKQVDDEINNVTTLEKATEYGILSGDCLGSLELVLREVYAPLLDVELAEGVNNEAVRVTNGVRNELRSNMQRFESQISHAHNQVKGEIRLELPDVRVDEDHIKEASEDYETVTKIEAAVDEWCRQISTIIDTEGRKVQEGGGPLAEIEFWRARNTSLSGLYEQINMPQVQLFIRVLQKAETSNLPVFSYQFAELSKLHAEAKDNVKFLTTLERHFKNIVTGSFSTILDTLPSMMHAIRMVWIISRHYNTDERMVPLMERIALKIADKVETEVNIRTVLHKSPDLAKKAIEEAKLVLDTWYNTYMDERQKIEEQGTDHRWQFDRKRLFEQTNYMAKVCSDLLEVTTVLDQFYKFLGPELKAVTGEAQGIDDVMVRVQGLVGPLEKVPFDIFDRKYRDQWNSVMVRFRKSVEEIENMTKSFIKQSFQKLRSAEGAFELVQNFRNIQSRESINQQINERYRDIIYQYMKELEHYQTLFMAQRANPPAYRNHPPVAGAIAWARDLYLRAKKPILRFQAHEGLLSSDYGQESKQRYLAFARSVDAFMTQLFTDWESRVQNVATEKLKLPILMSLREKEAEEAAQRGGGNNNPAAAAAGAPRQAQINPPPPSSSSAAALRIPPPPYRANFAPELTMIIRESKYLDRLGYQVPEMALNVTLQEDKFHRYVQDLNQMLKYYDSLMARLSTVEAQLLKRQISSLQKVLKAGFTPLNWNSQRIPSFIEACNKALNEFSGCVSQIHKSAAMIEEVVSNIESTTLVQEQDFRGLDGKIKPMEVLEFYDLIESKRISRLEGLVQKQKSIESPLIKVEELVAGTNTGTSPVLVGYYQYWEKKIYNAIAKMTISSLASFIVLLQGKYVAPLTKVTVTLNGKDIMLNPPVNDIYKYLTKLGKNIVESSKLFVRWMHGSCLECPPQIINEDDEPFVFSFLEVRWMNTILWSAANMLIQPKPIVIFFKMTTGYQPESAGGGAKV